MSEKTPETVEVLDEGDAPFPRGRPPIKLDSARGVVEELAAVYRAAKHGRMDPARAAKLAYLLQVMVRAHEVAVLEERITALEATYEQPNLLR